MKTIIRKLFPLVAALGLAMTATAARADVVSPFNIYNGNPTAAGLIVAGATELDWNSSGSGLAKGIGPFGTALTLDQGFEFNYQANLAAINGGVPQLLYLGLDPTSNGSGDLGRSYEFTIAAKLREIVTGVGVDSLGRPTVNFGLAGTSAQNKVAIFFDTAMNANTTTGTGFDDGIMIALLTIVRDGSTSSFTAFGPTSGQGSARLHAEIVEGGDFINPNYLVGITDFLFGMNFESTLNYPSPDVVNNFHASTEAGGGDLFPTTGIAGNDILFKVDGSNRFTINAVPEPASMMLLGVGLMGLVGATRRRKQAKG